MSVHCENGSGHIWQKLTAIAVGALASTWAAKNELSEWHPEHEQ